MRPDEQLGGLLIGLYIGFIAIAYALRERLIAPIGEEHLLIPTIFVWYMLVTAGWFTSSLGAIISVVYLPMTVLTLTHVLSKRSLKSPAVRTALYIWYMACMILITWAVWGRYGFYEMLATSIGQTDFRAAGNALIVGAISFRGLSAFCMLVSFQDEEDRFRELSDKFSERQFPPWQAGFLIVFNILVFVIHYHFLTRWVSELMLIGVLFVVQLWFVDVFQRFVILNVNKVSPSNR